MVTTRHKLTKVGAFLWVGMSFVPYGCSRRAWYEGAQGSAQQACTKTRANCPSSPTHEQDRIRR